MSINNTFIQCINEKNPPVAINDEYKETNFLDNTNKVDYNLAS
jgi:hypothetical protein